MEQPDMNELKELSGKISNILVKQVFDALMVMRDNPLDATNLFNGMMVLTLNQLPDKISERLRFSISRTMSELFELNGFKVDLNLSADYLINAIDKKKSNAENVNELTRERLLKMMSVTDKGIDFDVSNLDKK